MTDIILEDNDLKAKDGDFVVDESKAQHIEHIMMVQKGQFYQYPLLGVGIKSKIKGDAEGIKREILKQLKSDSIEIDKIDIKFEQEELKITII